MLKLLHIDFLKIHNKFKLRDRKAGFVCYLPRIKLCHDEQRQALKRNSLFRTMKALNSEHDFTARRLIICIGYMID